MPINKMLPCQKSFPLRTVHENHLVFTKDYRQGEGKVSRQSYLPSFKQILPNTVILSSFKIRGKTDEYLIRKNGKHDGE